MPTPGTSPHRPNLGPLFLLNSLKVADFLGLADDQLMVSRRP